MNAQLKLAYAIEYATRGWRVFPLYGIIGSRCTCGNLECNGPGKHPRIKNWREDATTDVMVIKKWWKQWPDANIAIATGNGLTVVDVDPRHDGHLSLKDVEIPVTAEVLTGGGGMHFYFKAEGTVRNRTNIRPGIDIRGDGGYVVAPPSNHISGGAYKWKL